MARPKLPSDIEAELLTLSRRRCAICFGLEGELALKRGQIAHLDGNPSNNQIDNLAFLCFDHHDEYDSSTRQSKGLQIKEVKIYRQGLYEAVRQYLEPPTGGETTPDTEPHSALLSQGELDFYLSQYQANLSEGLHLLSKVGEILDRFNAETSERTAQLMRLLSVPKFDIARHDAILQLGGAQLTWFANSLIAIGGPLSVVTSKMLNALTRSSAVASDIESADRSSFELRLSELSGLRETIQKTISSASTCRNEIATYSRGSTAFNRGKRLALAGIDDHVHKLSLIADAMAYAESELLRILDLL
jgi:hypothetical protein